MRIEPRPVSDSSLKIPALVLDGHLNSSLAAIRSLGYQGIPVYVGSHRVTATGRYSRYATHCFLYPSPLLDRTGFVESVKRLMQQLGRVVLFAFSDSTLLPLVRNSVLPDGQIQLCDRQLWNVAFDKARTLSLAEELGVPIPKTYICQTIGEACRVACELSFPVVLKPRRSVFWDGNRGVQQSPSFAFSEHDLMRKLAAAFSQARECPLLQEFVRGEEVGVEFLCRDGDPLMVCAHRRIRSASPRGGASVVSETIPDDYCGIGALARRLVRRLRWNGPAMVEFKICKRTHCPQLMEINGRFWGSLPLAVAAGVDFPFLFYRFSLGEGVPPGACELGVKARDFLGDALNLSHVLFSTDPLRPLLYPSRKRALVQFLRTSFQCRPASFALRDVLPSVFRWLDALNCRSSGYNGKLVREP